MDELSQIINHYKLETHKEGGYYKISFDDNEEIPLAALPPGFSAPRPYMNSILYLIPKQEKCFLHKIKMNEMWCYHKGGPLSLFQFNPDGSIQKIQLGGDIFQGEKVSHVVPKGCWMGALPSKLDSYTLVSCITAPGFTFDDWEAANETELLDEYPNHKNLIKQLSPNCS